MHIPDISRFLSKTPAGFLTFGSTRMALLDLHSGFWGIRRQIEALIGSRLTNSVLQQAGANGGASFSASFGAAAEIPEQELLFESCVQACQAAGFGRFTILEANQVPVTSGEVNALRGVDLCNYSEELKR